MGGPNFNGGTSNPCRNPALLEMGSQKNQHLKCPTPGATAVLRKCVLYGIYRAFDNRPDVPDVLCLCEVTKNVGKANEGISERYMIVLNN